MILVSRLSHAVSFALSIFDFVIMLIVTGKGSGGLKKLNHRFAIRSVSDRPPMTQNPKLGYACAIFAQVIWGLFPIYVDQLKCYDAFGFVAHRAIWSFLSLLALFWVAKFFRNPSLPQMSELTNSIRDSKIWVVASIAAILIATNWVGFVWAAINDHKLDASLGYYICPQVVVLLGVLCLGEKLKTIQWIAVALAACGVGYMVNSKASMPLLALMIAFSFGFYVLAKKKTKLSALGGLTFETGFLMIPAALYLGWQCGFLGLETLGDSKLALFTDSWKMNLLLLCSGMVTVLPLALYATAVKHIPLTTIGLLQFIGPTIQFLLGLFVYQEEFDESRFYGFLVVWAGVALYLFSLRTTKPEFTE